MRCYISKLEKQTIGHYLGGINQEISDVVKFQPYYNLIMIFSN